LCLHYGYDEAVWGLTEQYLVGTQFLAAPVLHEGAVSVQVYFPKHSGTWVHIVSVYLTLSFVLDIFGCVERFRFHTQ